MHGFNVYGIYNKGMKYNINILKKITTVSLLFNLILLFVILFTVIRKTPTNEYSPQQQSEINYKEQTDQTSDALYVGQTPDQQHDFPLQSHFFREGSVSVKSLNRDFERNIETVKLSFDYGDYSKNNDKSFIITMPTYDYIGDPKISFKEKYGCFTISSSGYTGYYIFEVASSEHIATGDQYSTCITWIDDHKVLISEKPYYYPDKSTFYILDAKTKNKQVISYPLRD